MMSYLSSQIFQRLDHQLPGPEATLFSDRVGLKIRRTKEVHRSVTDPVESKSSQFSRRKRHRVGLFSTGFFFS